MFNTEYIVATEHQVIQDGRVVDATLSYNTKLGPENELDAIEFFGSPLIKQVQYTNIYGVTNKSIVRAVYKKIGEWVI